MNEKIPENEDELDFNDLNFDAHLDTNYNTNNSNTFSMIGDGNIQLKNVKLQI